MSVVFVLAGNWQSLDWISVDIDGVPSNKYNLAPIIPASSTIQCGSSTRGFYKTIVGKVFHKDDSVTITINFSVTQGSTSNIPCFGIRDVTFRELYHQSSDSQGFDIVQMVSSVPDCIAGFYMDVTVGFCQPCAINGCSFCVGIQGQDCIRPGWASYYNGVSFSQCTTGCMLCTGLGTTDCVQCDSTHVLDYDNSCKTQCSSPYQPIGTSYKSCIMPCSSSQYLYWNNTCRDSCNYPLQTDSSGEQCIYPCNKAYAQFLYWNGLCLTTCPFIHRDENGYAFCDRCAIGYYLYPDENLCKLGCSYPYAIQEFVLCELDLSPSDKKETATMSEIMSSGRITVGIGSAVVSFLNPGDPSAFVLVGLTKMLFYTRYMDVKFPPKVQSVLDQQNIIQPSVKFLQKAQSLLEQRLRKYPLPGRFDHYKLHSSFLVNFLEPAITFTAILVVASLFSLGSCGCRQESLFATILRKSKDTLQWNLLASLYICQYDGVILYSSLEFRTTNSFDSFLSILSFLSSCTSVIFAVFLSIKMVTTIRALWIEIRQSGTQEQCLQRIVDFTKIYGGFRVFYESFRHSSLMHQSFYLVFTARLVIFHIIIAALIYHPFLQGILILLMSIFMFLYLCIKYPVINKLKLTQYIIQEAILLTVNVCVLIIACINLTGKEGYSTKKLAGEIFLYCNMILSMLGPVVILLMVVEQVIALIKNRRATKSRGVIDISTNIIPNVSGVVPQKILQSNNESNIMLFRTGMNQSQVHDLSLRPSDYDLKLHAEEPRVNITESGDIKSSVRAKSKKRTLEKQAYKRRLDQLRMQKPPQEMSITNETKSFNQPCQNTSILEDLGRPGSKSPERSLGVSNKNLSHNYRLESNSVPKDNAIILHGSHKNEEREPSWLRANKNKQYRIRGVEQYSESVLLRNASTSGNDKYINEPTLGNHSGCINLLRIKRPRDLDFKQEKE